MHTIILAKAKRSLLRETQSQGCSHELGELQRSKNKN